MAELWQIVVIIIILVCVVAPIVVTFPGLIYFISYMDYENRRRMREGIDSMSNFPLNPEEEHHSPRQPQPQSTASSLPQNDVDNTVILTLKTDQTPVPSTSNNDRDKVDSTSLTSGDDTSSQKTIEVANGDHLRNLFNEATHNKKFIQFGTPATPLDIDNANLGSTIKIIPSRGAKELIKKNQNSYGQDTNSTQYFAEFIIIPRNLNSSVYSKLFLEKEENYFLWFNLCKKKFLKYYKSSNAIQYFSIIDVIRILSNYPNPFTEIPKDLVLRQTLYFSNYLYIEISLTNGNPVVNFGGDDLKKSIPALYIDKKDVFVLKYHEQHEVKESSPFLIEGYFQSNHIGDNQHPSSKPTTSSLRQNDVCNTPIPTPTPAQTPVPSTSNNDSSNPFEDLNQLEPEFQSTDSNPFDDAPNPFVNKNHSPRQPQPQSTDSNPFEGDLNQLEPEFQSTDYDAFKDEPNLFGFNNHSSQPQSTAPPPLPRRDPPLPPRGQGDLIQFDSKFQSTAPPLPRRDRNLIELSPQPEPPGLPPPMDLQSNYNGNNQHPSSKPTTKPDNRIDWVKFEDSEYPQGSEKYTKNCEFSSIGGSCTHI